MAWERLTLETGKAATIPCHYQRRKHGGFVPHEVRRAKFHFYFSDHELNALARKSPEVQRLVKALNRSQHLLVRWRAYLDAEDRLGDQGIVIDTIRDNKDALAPFEDDKQTEVT